MPVFVGVGSTIDNNNNNVLKSLNPRVMMTKAHMARNKTADNNL